MNVHVKSRWWLFLLVVLAAAPSRSQAPAGEAEPGERTRSVFGFRDFSRQAELERRFLAVPNPKRAEEHLRTLTAEPHVAGTPEGKKTAEYVAQRFREAGLETELVEYRVYLNFPQSVSVVMTAPPAVKMRGPARERVLGDPYQNDPRVLLPFNGFSPSGTVEAEVVYANYGQPEDFDKLKELGVDVKGKIVVTRYGKNFRGVKSYVAQERGAAGVIIYSDPADDGYFKGDKYPRGPWRPDSGVQRGSILYMFKYPGDPTTPGVASTPGLPDAQRVAPEKAESLPRILTTPLSYADVTPILQNLAGPLSPREWQGALPFAYHVGPGPARVRLNLQHKFGYHSIWNVIGKVRGSELPEEWVIAGNHRDAWVHGAVDPSSGTAALLETANGIGALLKSGWKPRRTLVFASWDAEEQGLIGSTEWGEQYAKELANAAAYFNIDAAVAGPNFGASAVPSLKQFIRDATKSVPAAQGGTIYERWRERTKPTPTDVAAEQMATKQAAAPQPDVKVGDLGSGSDYTVFLQRLGVPATDVGSGGDYGVYHSVFDNFAWYKKFADPDFKISQQMARLMGIQILRMAQADVLPYDYESYGQEIRKYIEDARAKARRKLKEKSDASAFEAALAAADRFTKAGAAIRAQQMKPADAARLNDVLRRTERALLVEKGLPNRPWFRHAIYAPGEYTGYAAVVIPAVNEAIDKADPALVSEQLGQLAAVLDRATAVMQSYQPGP